MMMLIFVAFAVILLLTFVLVHWSMRPTRQETEMAERFEGVAKVKGKTQQSAHALEEFLVKTPQGSFQSIERLTGQTGVADRMRLLLLQADSTQSVGGVFLLSVAMACAALLAVWFFTGLWAIGLVVAVVASLMPIQFLAFQRKRRIARFDAVLAESIDMCVRALRAGHAIAAAIGMMAEQAREPARFEFAEVHKKQTYGLSLRDALNQMLERMPSTDLRVVVAGILVQRETGGNLAELLERIAVVLRKRARVQGEIRTNTAQGRMTGWILCLMPPVLLFLINLMSPGYSDPLFKDPLGRKMLYGAVAMLGIGAFAIRQIIHGIEV